MSAPISTSDESAFYARINGMNLAKSMDEVASELGRAKDPDFVLFLKGLRYFLQYGSIPGSFQSWQVARLRYYADALVAQGVLQHSVLSQFS